MYFSIEIVKPGGKPPVARANHQACFFNKYIAIYGGRNDSLYSDYSNTALNDLSLYNIEKNVWETVAMYGFIPNSRWGASMTVCHNKLIVFGGCNLHKYSNASLFLFEMEPKEFNKE